jgi:hypothetical protein
MILFISKPNIVTGLVGDGSLAELTRLSRQAHPVIRFAGRISFNLILARNYGHSLNRQDFEGHCDQETKFGTNHRCVGVTGRGWARPKTDPFFMRLSVINHIVNRRSQWIADDL